MKTYRLGQPEDWLKIPDVSMLTYGYLNDAINQATGTILYIYEDKTLLAATDVAKGIRALWRTQLHPEAVGRYLVRSSSYLGQEKLRIMLEHKVLNMLAGINADD